MSVARWSAYAPTAIAEMLAEIGRVDPEGLEAIEADLALGARCAWWSINRMVRASSGFGCA